MTTPVSASQSPARLGAVQPPAASQQPFDAAANGRGQTQILSVAWNQDSTCFAAAMRCGFRIYNCEPFKESIRRELKGGGFAIVEMLGRSNLMALVGDADNKQYLPNRAMIWDDRQGRCIGEFAFRSEITGVKLRNDVVVVALEHKIYVYNFVDLGLLHKFETFSNPKGLCCISSGNDTPILAMPGLHMGQVQIQKFGQQIKRFTAHDSELACFCLTPDGAVLATASIKGTLIRLFNTEDGTKLQELRRGTEKAEIYSIVFSQNSQWLACSSDKGTVHLFGLKIKKRQEDSSYGNADSHGPGIAQNDAPRTGSRRFSMSFIRGALPKYFSSERSFAQFRLPEVARYIVTFGSNNTVMILGTNGRFYRCSFDPTNGEMKQEMCIQFPEPDRHHNA